MEAEREIYLFSFVRQSKSLRQCLLCTTGLMCGHVAMPYSSACTEGKDENAFCLASSSDEGGVTQNGLWPYLTANTVRFISG